MLIGETTYRLQRGDREYEIELEFVYSPAIRAITYGPPEFCDPGTAAEIVKITSWLGLEPFPLSAEELSAAEDWLYANFDFQYEDSE